MDQPPILRPDREIIEPRRAPLLPQTRWAEGAVKAAITIQRMGLQAWKMKKESPDDPELFRGFEGPFLDTMNRIMCHDIGWSVTHETSTFEDVDPEKDRIVHIANHGSLPAVFVLAKIWFDKFVQNLVAVAKSEFRDDPRLYYAIGWVMEMTDKAIFIERADGPGAIETISEESIKLLTPGTGLAILPDTHRPKEHYLQADRAKFAPMFPELDIEHWVTCFPRTNGLWAIANATREDDGRKPVRFFDSTLIEPPPGTFQYGGNLHVDIVERTREDLFGSPESLEHLRGRVPELWQEKNEILRAARG